MEHARIFSASQLDAIFACPGRAVLTADAPRTSSQYSAWGTACHELAAVALEKGDEHYAQRHGTEIEADGFKFTVDDEMVEVAKRYTDYVRDVAGADGTVLVEQRVKFSHYFALDEHEAWGTADALIVRGDELIVVDLKTGRGVEVEADTAQLKAYALGCLEIAEAVADIERVRLVIVQPRAGGIKELDMDVRDLQAWADDVATPACATVVQALVSFDPAKHLVPGEKQCKFCAVKATCPALRESVADTALGFTPASPDEFAEAAVSTADEHSPADWLAAVLTRVDLIEDWCAAVRAEAHRRLSDGQPVPGFKLVSGKRGARQWADAKLAEDVLKGMRLSQEAMYDFKLISPTTAEKLAKAGTLGPRQWDKVKELITQPDGKPSVAPAADPRPALTVGPVAEDFPVLADNNPLI